MFPAANRTAGSARRALAVAAVAGLLAVGCSSAQHDRSAPAGPSSVAPSGPASYASVAPPSPSATHPAPVAALGRYYHQRVDWHACTASDEPAGTDLTGDDCTVVTVPLDYARPGGRKIGIAMARWSTPGEHRIGTLFINPGGPGASGIAYLPQLLATLPSAVREHFDVVGFDPRGVGRSAPVDCVGDRTLDVMFGRSPAPTTPAEEQAFVSDTRAFSSGCARRSGWLLPYLGTAYAARDLDVLRAAVGDPRLTYLGKSYGTLLGATYADEFPHRVRALVLDGAVDPATPTVAGARQQAQGFELDLSDFLADCVRRSDCPLGSDVATARRRLDALLAEIRAHPLPASGAQHGPLTLGYAMAGIAVCLYSPDLWHYLRTGLAAARGGDGSVLMELADAYNERHADGHYSNLMEAFAAISCADGPGRVPVSAARRYARLWARDAPYFGPEEAWGLLSCDWWPARPTSTPRPLRAAGAPPILVVGTTRDPATPYVWAQRLAAELASGRLLGYAGDGHTSYGEGKSACLDGYVDAYLVDLRLPPSGTLCRP